MVKISGKSIVCFATCDVSPIHVANVAASQIKEREQRQVSQGADGKSACGLFGVAAKMAVFPKFERYRLCLLVAIYVSPQYF